MRRAVALLLVIALALSAVGVAAFLVARGIGPSYEPTPVAVPPDAPPAAQPPDDSLDSFYEQRVVWRPCGADQCATVDVPLDYAHPDQQTISLNLVRRPAEAPDDKIGSLPVLEGGRLAGIITETDLLRRVVGDDACCQDVTTIVVSYP